MKCRRMRLEGAVLVATSLLSQTSIGFAASATGNLTQLDQVDVYADRTISQLRRELVEAEDRFYSEYNELNDKDEFDVQCKVDARTGTRLTTRACVPQYQVEAIREGTKQAVEIRQGFQSLGGEALLGANSPPVPAAVAIMARRPEFEQNMRTVVSRSRVLRRLLEERAQAQARLEAAQRRVGDDDAKVEASDVAPIPRPSDVGSPSTRNPW